MNSDGSCASVSLVAGKYTTDDPAANNVGFNGDGRADRVKFHDLHGVNFVPLAPGEKPSKGSTVMFAIDDFNERVRRIDLTTNTVTTLAGNGTSDSNWHNLKGTGCNDGK